MSKYNMRIKGALMELERNKPYKDLQYAIVEYPNMLGIRVFENNIMEYDVDKRVIIMEYLELLRKTVENFGVRCELEGVKGNAPRRR